MVAKAYSLLMRIPLLGIFFRKIKPLFLPVTKTAEKIVAYLEKIRPFQVRQSYLVNIAFGNLRARANRTLAVSYTHLDVYKRQPYTRTSADGADWSAWTAAASKKTSGATSEYEIKSPDNRYIQVKFDLTSGDGLYSDVIDDYSINYYVDAAAPTNPTALSAYTTATQSASITTNTWYANAAPNFDWPDSEAVGGATDGTGGAGVAGYYVYFGTNASADPETDGALQTTTAYTASSLTTGQTYYLRIKTVDDADLISATTWEAFIYKYDATAPTNPSNVSSNPPGYSTNSSFTFTWTAGTDTESGVADYCYSTQTAGITETCTSDRIATASAYTTGANSFYVRTRAVSYTHLPIPH